MSIRNQSIITEFVLVGFPTSTTFQLLLFGVFFSFHTVTITANMLIIVVVKVDRHLRRIPMYIFLCHLSFLEIWYTNVTVPKMLGDFLSETRKISFSGCVLQIYFFVALGLTELFLLAAMAFDRHVAICHPLRYTPIMTRRLCRYLNSGSWISGFFTGLLLVIPVTRFYFCGSFSVDHFFCDIVALLNLSCKEIQLSDILVFVITWTIIIHSLLFTILSYSNIIQAILKIPSTKGKRKAFSTCASHLIVVFIFYGTITFMYVRPTSSYAVHVDKVVSVFYAVVTPLLNPMVYTLRNTEFKAAVRRTMKIRNRFN
ncbi:olfactory receptor 6Y1-like [Lissotriton helveticus]